MPSFKPLSRKGVKVSGGDRIAVEALVLASRRSDRNGNGSGGSAGHSSRERRAVGRHPERAARKPAERHQP